jgi:hypothetical protein
MKTIATEMRAKMTQRLQQLINLGEVALTAKPLNQNVSQGKYNEWRLASVSFLRKVLGASDDYCKFFDQRVDEVPNDRARNIEEGLGILRAVKGEIDFGPLPQIAGLISGEIFEDFIDMAGHLLENSYIQVVPSLVGAVLEDALRRIAQAHGVPVKPESDNIASLNGKLAEASVYSNFVRKKVALWNATRNNADHGKFSDNSEQDVRVMLEGVRDFLGTYLS